jgi:tetratricopeptide (TPR) repeat protein
MLFADIETLRQEPDSAARTIQVARLLTASGNHADAINELQAGIASGQEQADVYNELGLCFLAGKDAKLARRAFTEALGTLGSGNQAAELKLEALYGLSQAEELLGNYPEAIYNLEQLLVIRHNYRDCRKRIDGLIQQQSRPTGEGSADATGRLLDEILSLLGPGPTGDGSAR